MWLIFNKILQLRDIFSLPDHLKGEEERKKWAELGLGYKTEESEGEGVILNTQLNGNLKVLFYS